MSVKTVNEIFGKYEVSKGVNQNDLEILASNPKTQSIQFASPLTDKEIELLELVVFSKRPDISLRVYGHYGETCDLAFIQKITSLRKFSADCLTDANGSDLSFISELRSLQNLFIQSLKHITKLPDFSNNKKLIRIYLENLKGLKDLSALKNAPSLKEFIYVSAENQEPENLIPVLENPTVEMVFCRFGNDKKNNRFDELAKQYNKSEYKHETYK
jgi:hypothetical protein